MLWRQLVVPVASYMRYMPHIPSRRDIVKRKRAQEKGTSYTVHIICTYHVMAYYPIPYILPLYTLAKGNRNC